MNSFELTESEFSGFPLLTFSGYCAEDGGSRLQDMVAALLEQEKCFVIIDFTECTVVSSPGLASILDLVMEICEDYRGAIVFVGLDEGKEKFFNMTGVLPIAKTAKTLEKALEILKT